MSPVPLRGRSVKADRSGKFTDRLASAINERFHAIERALLGTGIPTVPKSSLPGGGTGSGSSGGSGGGGGGGGGTSPTPTVTDHGALTGLADDDHPQYAQKGMLMDPKPHVHSTADIIGLLDEIGLLMRLQAHTHRVDEIHGAADDSQVILAGQIFGG